MARPGSRESVPLRVLREAGERGRPSPRSKPRGAPAGSTLEPLKEARPDLSRLTDPDGDPGRTTTTPRPAQADSWGRRSGEGVFHGGGTGTGWPPTPLV